MTIEMLEAKVAPRRKRGRLGLAGAFTLSHFREWALRLSTEDGEPWVLEPFQEAYIEDYFGGRSWVEDGPREFWWIIPEGNGKTTTLAGLGLYLVEHRRRANVSWAASARDQAELGFVQAEMFVKSSERLKSFIKCQGGIRKVKNTRPEGGVMKIFASDEGPADGTIPTDAFLDELHRHKNLRLYRTFRGKLNKRNGQLAAISTAGEPGSEFEQTRIKIRSGADWREQDGSHLRCGNGAVLMHEWMVPEDGDVSDMGVVKSANPFSGVTVEDLAEKFESPTMTLGHWRRINCNLATRSEDAAITEAEWNAAHKGWAPIPAGIHVDAGLDVGWKMDCTALVPLWGKSPEERIFGVPTILTPPRDGNMLDPDKVKRALVVLNDRNPIDVLVMDTSGAEDIAGWASSELDCEVIDRSQTNSFKVVDYNHFMLALRSGWLRQPGDPEFTRHVLNAVAKTLPGGDAVFERSVMGRTKNSELQDRRVIDALVAAAMVNSLYAAEHETNPYEDREMVVL